MNFKAIKILRKHVSPKLIDFLSLTVVLRGMYYTKKP